MAEAATKQVTVMNTVFVWTKMGVEAGQRLEDIVIRKEGERIKGGGEFWWGIGTSLGSALREVARERNGSVPVVFSKTLGRAKVADSAPEAIWRWTGWQDEFGRIHDIPAYAKVISRGAATKERHYALVCQSDVPLILASGGAHFDPAQCRTLTGKIPGTSQVTALLRGEPETHRSGAYQICFRARLVEPWAVKLVRPQRE